MTQVDHELPYKYNDWFSLRDRQAYMTVCNGQLRDESVYEVLSLASAVTRTPSCSQHVSWSWSQTTDRYEEKAQPNVYPPPFIVVSVHRNARQLIKLCFFFKCYFLSSSICCLPSMAPSPHRRPHRHWSIMAASSIIASLLHGDQPY